MPLMNSLKTMRLLVTGTITWGFLLSEESMWDSSRPGVKIVCHWNERIGKGHRFIIVTLVSLRGGIMTFADTLISQRLLAQHTAMPMGISDERVNLDHHASHKALEKSD